jgi:plastocyanin
LKTGLYSQVEAGNLFAATARMSIKAATSAFVLAAALGIAACSSSNPAPAPTPPTPTPPPTPTTTTVSMVSGAFRLTTTAFSPNPVTVPVGSTVMFVNNDTATHDARADNGNFSTPFISPGASANVTMSTAGSFVYHCSIHPGMVGTIVVQ